MTQYMMYPPNDQLIEIARANEENRRRDDIRLVETKDAMDFRLAIHRESKSQTDALELIAERIRLNR